MTPSLAQRFAPAGVPFIGQCLDDQIAWAKQRMHGADAFERTALASRLRMARRVIRRHLERSRAKFKDAVRAASRYSTFMVSAGTPEAAHAIALAAHRAREARLFARQNRYLEMGWRS